MPDKMNGANHSPCPAPFLYQNCSFGLIDERISLMKELNLTQGSVPKVLLQFAVPFLIANALQALYGGADLFVVGQYDDSASVAAIATVTAQGISFATALGFLHRRGFHFEFTKRDIRLNRVLSKRVLTLGAPIALQDALINVSFLIIIVFAMLPPITISSAVATMTAQNYGAELIQRMNKCFLSGIGFALVFGLSACLYSQFLPETLTAFFTKDPAVVAMAAEYLRGYSIDCIVVSFVFCINSYFSGQGNSLFPMIHSLIATFLFRIPLSYWFSQIDSSSLFIMGFAPPISTVVSLLICIWYLRYSQKIK